MSISKRLDNAEMNLTPRQSMILWMREAHEFGSLQGYARWLLNQPDDAYPLIRMSRQVVGAVRARSKGNARDDVRDKIYRVQKDVLFLYFLHQQVEMKALVDHEAIQLRVIILIKEYRALVREKHALDQLRVSRIDLEGNKHGRPDEVEKTMRTHYEEHAQGWLPQAREVRKRIAVFFKTAEILSRRYFASEDILYPEVRENLDWCLGTIETLTESYADSILGGSPETDDEFRDYVLALLDDKKTPEKGEDRPPVGTETSRVTREARRLAEQWILMARSETFEKLGEERAAEALAGQLMREVL